MKYKYFFFDFDGMMVDSYKHITASLVAAIKESRNIELPFKEVYDNVKITLATAFNKYNFNDKEQALYKKYEHDIDFEPLVEPYKEMLPLLKHIYENNGRIFVYTNRSKCLEDYLDKFNFAKYIECSYKKVNKPDPTILNDAITSLKFDKSKCLFLGDRELDVNTGINASIDTLLFDEDNKILNTKATYKVNKIEEIYKFID